MYKTGALVEVHGVLDKLEPSPETKLVDPGAEAVDVNGQKGRVLGWSEKDGKYIIETFDGVVLGVAEHNLKDDTSPAPEDGGFDVAWPTGPSSNGEFSLEVMRNLEDKGYCMVQMFANANVRDSANDEASDLGSWRMPTEELESAYLGLRNVTKYAVLPQDDFRKPVETGLGQCDRFLSNMGLLLRPLTQESFGFTIDGRTNGNVCVPLANTAEGKFLRPSSLNDGDVDAQQKIHGHVNFLALRRVKVMYIVEADGGELQLYNLWSNGELAAQLPICRNRLLVFLPDRLSYSYAPTGNSLLLQTWFLSQPPVPKDPDSRKVVHLPQLQTMERVHFTSLCTRIPGGVADRHQAWSMWISGSDGAKKIPTNRFDIDMYYDPEPYIGKLYTQHSATMDDIFMDWFDHEHFNIPYAEAKRMGAGQRNLMEIGMESFYQANYDKESLWGYHCGVYIGDKNTDRKALVPGQIMMSQYSGEEVNSYFHSGYNSGVTASRLSYSLNLKGPVTDIDTACSSALVAMGEAMKGMRTTRRGDLNPTASTAMKTSLVLGMDLVEAPHTLFAYCSAQMVSIGGRSFTFDESANGFLRGDGVGGCVLELGGSDEDAQEMLACLMGTNVNQDGKSASLSAPHGPSQQQCIRASMQEAGLQASEITIAECHGTGTALGDPIEVGALRETMKKREIPMIVTSAKSNFGHTEAAAGICGIARCLVMLLAMSGAPNLHLKSINPHIEYMGYPALFIQEPADCGCKTGISGVSSFGVGGTNARGDIWARSVLGYLASDIVMPVRKLAFMNSIHNRIKENGKPGPSVSDEIFLFGSWNSWTEMTEMENTKEGEWTACVTLGDCQRERFRVVLNRIPHMAFYPASDEADQGAQVFGPDWEGHENSWVIDARMDGCPTHGIYQITFSWGFSYETGEYRQISWERVESVPESLPYVDGRNHRHSYWLAGTWTSWKPRRMLDNQQELVHQGSAVIGHHGYEEFQILRDQDWKQVLHPAAAKTMKMSVPVRGPDANGGNKTWVIRGQPGDKYDLTVEVIEDFVLVKAVCEHVMGGHTKLAWRTCDRDDGSWHDYWVLGSFPGTFIPMVPDKGGISCYRCFVKIGPSGEEDFQISVDHDPDMLLHPTMSAAALGDSTVSGPDALGYGLAWTIVGEPGTAYEIVLDWTERPNKVVSWTEAPDMSDPPAAEPAIVVEQAAVDDDDE